jgi:hypothetical protein
MHRTRLLAATVALAIVAGTGHQSYEAHERSSAAVVIEWNQIVQDTIPGAGGVLAPRFYSMVHIAMFDAINAIEREYSPYRVRLREPGRGSAEAAAAQAAHDVLVGLNGPSAAVYDAALARQLGSRPSDHTRRGAGIGARVAKEILAWRQADGWIVSGLPPYEELDLPGRYRKTPPNNPAAAFMHLQNAIPMALLTSTQYLPPPPPLLTSGTYATDLSEVQSLGRFDSQARTHEQTEIARLWASLSINGSGTATHNFAIWNNITRDAVRDRRLSLVDAARVFALVNVSIHDGLHTTQASKYVYHLWRPVTAIRNAQNDLNPATEPDPEWLPLITTPPYPSYAGNMACIGASAARALQLAFGTNDAAVTATWKQSNAPDVSYQFTTFSAAADQQYMARIWGGVHYRFDQVAGQRIGNQVAEFVFANYMSPRGSWND